MQAAGGAALSGSSTAAVHGSRRRVGACGGLDWIHTAEVHGALAENSRRPRIPLMPATAQGKRKGELYSELGQLETEQHRLKYLSRHKALVRTEAVKELANLVLEKI